VSDLIINGALITLLIAVVGAAVRITRTMAADNADLKQKLNDQDKAHAGEIGDMQRAHSAQIDGLRREFGETASALRSKLHEIETWARDEFVRKGSFELVVGRLEKGIESLGEKIERHLDKMTERLEKIRDS